MRERRCDFSRSVTVRQLRDACCLLACRAPEKEGEKNITGDTRQRVSFFEPVVKKNLRSTTVCFAFFRRFQKGTTLSLYYFGRYNYLYHLSCVPLRSSNISFVVKLLTSTTTQQDDDFLRVPSDDDDDVVVVVV